jgi:hypothetical protein
MMKAATFEEIANNAEEASAYASLAKATPNEAPPQTDKMYRMILSGIADNSRNGSAFCQPHLQSAVPGISARISPSRFRSGRSVREHCQGFQSC